MNPEQRAQSRHQIYKLLSVVLLDRLTPETFESIKRLPNLPLTAPKTFDDWKAIHYALFGLNVYPYENEFLNEEGFLGGTVTQSLATLYSQAEFQAYDSEPLDHIGNQLGCMSSLSLTEADARHDEVIQAIHHTTNVQRQMLDEHLLRWTPALVMAIYEQGEDTFSFLTDILLNTLLNHRIELADDSSYPTLQFKMPPTPDILNQAGTGFRDIANYLLTPIYSGFYLSRDDIVRLSQNIGLPHGHGKRYLMLTRLMNNAIEVGKLVHLLNLLEDKAVRWQEFYQHEVTISHYADLWIERLDATRRFISVIRNEL